MIPQNTIASKQPSEHGTVLAEHGGAQCEHVIAGVAHSDRLVDVVLHDRQLLIRAFVAQETTAVPTGGGGGGAGQNRA